MIQFLTPDPTYKYAPCVGESTELFFTERDITLAKTICATCPVLDTCRAGALERNERFGVFGGLTANERNQIRKAAREPREPPPMSTDMTHLQQHHLFAPPEEST